MTSRSQPPSHAPRYTVTAIALHWLLALALFGTFALGVYMHELPVSPWRLKLYSWHKWAGVTILALSFVRLAWRVTHRPPEDVPMPGWQRQASHAAHHLLYVLFFVVPLMGWAYSSAAGFPVVWFGVLPLPDFVPVDRDLAGILKKLHEVLAIAMATIVLVHVAGAIKHHFIDRDGLLKRMALRG
jgi:cytochrome b561